MINMIANRKVKNNKQKDKKHNNDTFLEKIKEESKRKNEISKFLEEYYTSEQSPKNN